MNKIIKSFITISTLSFLFGCSTSKVESSLAVQKETPTPTATLKPEEKPTPTPTATPTPEPTIESVVLSYPDQFDLASVPEYSGSPYAVVNDNVPYFTKENESTSSYESYSELDDLGRCSVAVANVGRDIMPTGKRGSIGMIKPTGENANERNLITGTRYMNVEGMLPFENQVADYVN